VRILRGCRRFGVFFGRQKLLKLGRLFLPSLRDRAIAALESLRDAAPADVFGERRLIGARRRLAGLFEALEDADCSDVVFVFGLLAAFADPVLVRDRKISRRFFSRTAGRRIGV
jgi:hypothetical protein